MKGPGRQGSIIQSIGQGTGWQAGSGQAEVDNPEVEQRYKTAGRPRVRLETGSGQAGGYRVRTGKGQKPGGREQKRD
jgi:hypothetical protein